MSVKIYDVLQNIVQSIWRKYIYFIVVVMNTFIVNSTCPIFMYIFCFLMYERIVAIA